MSAEAIWDEANSGMKGHSHEASSILADDFRDLVERHRATEYQ